MRFFIPILALMSVVYAKNDGIATVTVEDVAHGGTPDGMTPAMEDICDQYEGTKAKGLCVAFCEAKDCDTGAKNDKSCDKIKENFQKITGEDYFPCEARCPCWDIGRLDRVTPDNVHMGYSRFTASCYLFRSSYNWEHMLLHADEVIDEFNARPTIGYGVFTTQFGEVPRIECLQLTKVSPRTGIISEGWSHEPLEVTREEYDICLADLQSRCSELGLL